MFKQQLSLFSDDAAGFFLPWMTMLMVFLASLALAGSLAIGAMLDHWNKNVSGSLTVQVMPASENGEQPIDAARSQLESALIILRDTPGVVEARALSEDELISLLEPWLGNTKLMSDLPIPLLIDVSLDENIDVNLDMLEEKLQHHAPLASLDNHRLWLSKLISLAERLRLLASAVVALVLLATSATVVYATRTSMNVHRPVIQLLHLMGAYDRFIAKQYAMRTIIFATGGGLAGLALAIPTTLGVGSLVSHLQGGLVGEATLGTLDWLMLCLVPLFAGVLAMCTAYITVRKTLLKML